MQHIPARSLGFAFLTTCVFLGASHGQTANPADWVTDVDRLLERMEAMHPDIYRYTSRNQWQSAAAQLRRRLPELEPHVALLEFRRLVALAGDGHTYFRNPDEAWGKRRYLPLFLRRFESGWYVRTGDKRYADLFGQQIVAMEAMPLPEVLRRLEPYVGTKNRMRFLDVAPQFLRLPQVLHAIGVTKSLTDTVSITAMDKSGHQRSVDVTAQPDWINEDFQDADVAVSTAKPVYRTIDANFDYVHYPEHDALYFYFGEVRDTDDETIAAFGRRMFAEIEAKKIGKLVIDLRENNGGNLYLFQPLMHAIIRHDYRPGSLFVLIGRDTWSAAMAFAVQLERETSAIFVGEPTPSPPNFWGDTEPIALPASGIVVECSSLWWQFSDPRDQRDWIAPDIPVVESFKQFMDHRDVALEAVWNYRPHVEKLAPGSEETYDLQTFELPAVRWQRVSQTEYDDSWMR